MGTRTPGAPASSASSGPTTGASRPALEAQIADSLKAALALDDNDSDVHRILAAIYVVQNDLERSGYHQQRALSLNPNDDLVVVQQGELLTWLGHPAEGIEWIRKAMRLNPYHPERFWNHLARAHFAARQYGDALEALRRIRTPDALQRAAIAACHARLGETGPAEQQRLLALAAMPTLTIGECIAALHYKRAEDVAHHRESLELAGFPA